MPFQIKALSADRFAPLFALDDAALAGRLARRVRVEGPGYPCRVSLEDGRPGETVMLLHFEHQPAPTPFRASHAIYVREGAETAHPAPGEIPALLRERPLSLRAFDASGMLLDAELAEGAAQAAAMERLLSDPRVDHLQAHYARYGCFAARVDRA